MNLKFFKKIPWLVDLIKPDDFLLSGRVDRWTWPWALLGTVVGQATLILITLGAALPYYITGIADSYRAFEKQLPGDLFVILVIAISFSAAALVPVIFVHGHDKTFLLGQARRLHVSQCIRASLASLVAAIIVTCVNLAVIGSDKYTFHPKTPSHIFWFILAAILIFLQAFSEELLFRGYLARVWGAVVPIRWIIILLLSLAFASLHITNEDVAADIVAGLTFMLVSELLTYAVFFRTRNLGASAGLHWMNNFLVFCFVGFQRDRSQELAFFTVPLPDASSRQGLADWYVVFLTFLSALIIWLLLTWKRSPFYLPPASNIVPQASNVKII